MTNRTSDTSRPWWASQGSPKILKPLIPHKSVNETTPHDCGACVLAMILSAGEANISPKDVLSKADRSLFAQNRLSPKGLLHVAKAFDLKLRQGGQEENSLLGLKDLLDHGKPVVALVNYDGLPESAGDYTGAHFVLVVGYNRDGQVIINDPHLLPGSNQNNLRCYPYETIFKPAWGAADFVQLIPDLQEPPLELATFGVIKIGDNKWVIAPLGLRLRSEPDASSASNILGGLGYGQHLNLLAPPESVSDAQGCVWHKVKTDQDVLGWVAAVINGEAYLADEQPIETYIVQVLSAQPVIRAGGLKLRPVRETNIDEIESIPVGTLLTVSSRRIETDGTPWLEVKTARGNSGWVREKAEGILLVGAPGYAALGGCLVDLPEMQQLPFAPGSLVTAPPNASLHVRRAAQIWNDYGGIIAPLATRLGIDPAVAVAVTAAESGGRGLGPDGRMIIRFENHIFWGHWGQYHADAFNAHFCFDANKSWDGRTHAYRPDPASAWRSFHGDQAEEWNAFGLACTLDAPAAMVSISMGLPQIMGFNYAALGYKSVQAMFDAFGKSERTQLIGFFDFVREKSDFSPKVAALQRGDFRTFAAKYNGPAQAGDYESIIRSFYDGFKTLV